MATQLQKPTVVQQSLPSKLSFIKFINSEEFNSYQTIHTIDIPYSYWTILGGRDNLFWIWTKAKPCYSTLNINHKEKKLNYGTEDGERSNDNKNTFACKNFLFNLKNIKMKDCNLNQGLPPEYSNFNTLVNSNNRYQTLCLDTEKIFSSQLSFYFLFSFFCWLRLFHTFINSIWPIWNKTCCCQKSEQTDKQETYKRYEKQKKGNKKAKKIQCPQGTIMNLRSYPFQHSTFNEYYINVMNKLFYDKSYGLRLLITSLSLNYKQPINLKREVSCPSNLNNRSTVSSGTNTIKQEKFEQVLIVAAEHRTEERWT